MSEGHPNPKNHWQNRKRMAWLSMIAGLGYPVFVLLTDSDQLGQIATPFYLFVGAVVGAYIGFSSMEGK